MSRLEGGGGGRLNCQQRWRNLILQLDQNSRSGEGSAAVTVLTEPDRRGARSAPVPPVWVRPSRGSAHSLALDRVRRAALRVAPAAQT
jgi:hypothetical protein